MENNQYRAHNSQNRSRYKADCAVADTVGKLGGDQGCRSCHNDANQHDIPALQNDGRVNDDMADRSDQRGEGHNKGARSHGGFQLHAEERSENNQHHHAAARSHKASAEAYGQAKEEGDEHAFSVELFALGGGVFPRGVRLYQETDPDTESQEQRETAQYHIPSKPCHIAADRAHREDTGQHDPAALQVNILMLCVGGRCDRRAKDVRGERNGGSLVGTGLSAEAGAEHDQDRHHHRCRRQTRKARPNSGTQRRNDVPDIFQNLTSAFLLNRSRPLLCTPLGIAQSADRSNRNPFGGR